MKLQNAWDLWELQPKNKLLLAGYKGFSTSLDVPLETSSKLSCPLFIHLGPYFDKFWKKVFIVGKETSGKNRKTGWRGNSDTVGNSFSSFVNYTNSQCCREHIMMETQSQWLIDHLENRHSAFHQALKKISGTKNGRDFLKSGFVWDDLIAMDYNGGSIGKVPKSKKNERKAILDYSKKKFIMELDIVQPTHIIFFTGVDKNYTYDGYLKFILDLDREVKDYPSLRIGNEVVDDVKHFTWKNKIECYRTHHPQRMNFLRKNNIIDILASLFLFDSEG